jgi:hypothetical protein
MMPNMADLCFGSACRPSGEWRRKLVLGFAVLALYWLYGWHPFLIQTWLVVDDGLYVRQAEGFLTWVQGSETRWLGPFDCFLLAKTPLFGIWLGFLHLLGLPLRVGEFLLMLAGGFLFRRAVRPIRELRLWEFTVALVILLANPCLSEDFRLARFGLQTALTNLCLVAAIGLSLRAQALAKARQRWALLTGVLFSLAYLNREDATWLMLAVFTAFLIQWLVSFLAWRDGDGTWRSRARAELLIGLCLAAGALPPILAVCTLNKAHYGAFTTTFRRNAALTGLYQRLTSLEPAGHQPYVPIARATRMKAYDLSPTFAKMKPFLEGKEDYWHAGNEHSAVHGRSPADMEFFVSYFEFSLLWAAEKIGAKNAGEMETIFRAIERELTTAVRERKIVAGASGPAILAAPVSGDYRRIVSALWVSFSSLLFGTRDGLVVPAGRQDSQAHLESAGRLTHSWVALSPHPASDYILRGPLLRFLRKAQRVFYPLLFLSLPGLLIWKRSEVFVLRPRPRAILLWSSVIPIAALFAFCLSMAVVEVLGFKFLAGVAYNLLGFSPLTVLCAFAFTCLTVFVSCRPQASVVREKSVSVSDSR